MTALEGNLVSQSTNNRVARYGTWEVIESYGRYSVRHVRSGQSFPAESLFSAMRLAGGLWNGAIYHALVPVNTSNLGQDPQVVPDRKG